ncbi:MAG TPA: hypothetical protein VK866_08965 [Acidimicrobiales bacterium]|nr:hypothetical protein [Acidimicrobiales bacterium]
MEDTTKALAFGAVRAGVGAALLAAPGLAGRSWVGPHADGPGAKVFARAVGARDLLLGLRTMESVRHGRDDAQGWIIAGYAADGADVLATLVAWKHLTPGRRIAMPIIAAAVGGFGYLTAATFDD